MVYINYEYDKFLKYFSGKFLTPDNYWVEINDNNEIPKILNDIGINVNNHISYVIDRGYGDIIGRTNYWLWFLRSRST